MNKTWICLLHVKNNNNNNNNGNKDQLRGYLKAYLGLSSHQHPTLVSLGKLEYIPTHQKRIRRENSGRREIEKKRVNGERER